MQHKAPAGLHRTAPQHLPVADALGQVDDLVFVAELQVFEDVAEAQVFEAIIDDEAHGSLIAMADHVDDALLETGVAHIGHGHQKLPAQ